MSDSVQPLRRQPTRLPHPWDFPGKNTGVGWHFLLQCMKVKSESEVAQLCPTASDPMDCSLPGSSNHGICQARVLKWVVIAFSVINWSCFYWQRLNAFWRLFIWRLAWPEFPNFRCRSVLNMHLTQTMILSLFLLLWTEECYPLIFTSSIFLRDNQN